jgi:endoglucanase
MSLFWSQWMGQYYTTNVVHWLRNDWACDVVRVAVGVTPDGVLGHPEKEIAKAKVVIQAAIDCGLYVVVDWHDHNAHEHQAQSIAFFEEIARTYGKRPNIIYETWNEPLAKHDWVTVIKPYHEAVVAKIRAIDPDNLIVLGTQTWSQDVDKASLNPVKGVNLAYSLHYYAATHKEGLRQKARTALSKGVALFVTEWGTCEASGNGRLDEEECRQWFSFMEKNNLSWCNWSIADKVETSAALRPKASSNGGWTSNDLSPSGQFVRAELLRSRR